MKKFSNIWDEFVGEAYNKVFDQFQNSVSEQIYFRLEVESQVWSQVRGQTCDQIKDQINEIIS